MMKDVSTAFCDVEVLVVCKSCNKLPFFVEIVEIFAYLRRKKVQSPPKKLKELFSLVCYRDFFAPN